jgi:hypothetical protein
MLERREVRCEFITPEYLRKIGKTIDSLTPTHLPERIYFWQKSYGYLNSANKLLLLYRTDEQIQNNEYNLCYSDLNHRDEVTDWNAVEIVYGNSIPFLGSFMLDNPYFVIVNDNDEAELRNHADLVDPSEAGLTPQSKFIGIVLSDGIHIDRVMMSPGLSQINYDLLLGLFANYNIEVRTDEISNLVREKFGNESKVSLRSSSKDHMKRLCNRIVEDPISLKLFDFGLPNIKWHGPLQTTDSDAVIIAFSKTPNTDIPDRKQNVKKKSSRKNRTSKAQPVTKAPARGSRASTNPGLKNKYTGASHARSQTKTRVVKNKK